MEPTICRTTCITFKKARAYTNNQKIKGWGQRQTGENGNKAVYCLFFGNVVFM